MSVARQSLLPFTAGIAFSCLVYLFIFSVTPRQQPTGLWPQNKVVDQTLFKAPAPNLWIELDHGEVAELYDYLYAKSGLNLTQSPEDHGLEKYLADIEVLRPNKSDAVAYLDSGSPIPSRYARVSLVESEEDQVFICEYRIGPLPPSQSTTTIPLTYSHTNGKHCVESPIPDFWEFLLWALNIGLDIKDITQDLLGGAVNELDPWDPDALWVGVRPTSIEHGHIIYWLEFFRNGPRSDGRSLLPQGLYAKLHTSSPNPDDWHTAEWYYNGNLYADLGVFRTAWESGGIKKALRNLDGPWTDTEDFESRPLGRSKPPPLSIQPHGRRYSIDRKAAYVSWMGFTFYLATSASRALSLHDVRFNNTRIIYEIGLQEALAHYAGSEPMQSGLEFLDTFFGMGSMMFSLLPGIDCPAYADYLDMTYHKAGETFVNSNAICLFEYTSDAPLQRHTSAFSVTASRNTYLVVRSVSTVGNYDYTIDYVFFLDGSIEVKVRASGFIFGAFAGEQNDTVSNQHQSSDELRPRSKVNPNHQYGYQIGPAVSTSMHDHVLLFRADIDLPNPTSNTFQKVTLDPTTLTYPWDLPELPSRNTMHLVKSTLTNETSLNWPPNSATMYLIQSNATNAWCERRSYRIQPGTGMGTPSHLAIHNSMALGQSALWSSADIWVLKQRDNETLAAHERNFLSPNDPLIDFSYLANNETINEDDQGDDIVVLFNLGGHHVPHSGDIPNTLMHTSASSVIFSPFNFFDEDVSKESRQGVRVDGRRNPGKDGWEKGVRWFGGKYGDEEDSKESKVLLDIEKDLEPGLDGYFQDGKKGDVKENRVGGGIMGLYGSRARSQRKGPQKDRKLR